MKILQVLSAFYPAWKYGGTVPAVFNVSKELVKRGHDVTVYTSDTIDNKTRQKEKYLEIEGIKVYYFRNLSNRLAWNRLSFSPGIIPKVRREIKTFDIVHSQSLRCFQGIVAHHYATKYGIPFVVQPRDTYMTFFQKGGLKRVFDRVFGHRMFRDAAMVIAERPTEAKQYQDTGMDRNRIEILPLGVDLSEYDNLPERGVFREKYNLSDRQKIVLYLGRIDRVKGPDLLVEAFSGLANNMDDVTLVIVGPDAGYLSELKELIREKRIEKKVIFTGSLLGKDKLAAYVDADVYVMPSWHEGFSITPLEAYACGTTVITTDLCGTAEWMANDFDYVIPYDRDRLEETMNKALAKENLESRLGRQSKRLNLIQERFSWESVAKMTEDTYKKILDSVNR